MLVTWLVLDTSPSMTFGTAERRKADVALGVTLAVGHAATMRGNRVGLVGFGASRARAAADAGARGARRPAARAPRRRRTGSGAAGTSISATALHRLAGAARQRALVVIVSDFRGPRDWRRPLLRLAGRHEVVAVEMRDPREQELEPVGTLWLVDPETGRELQVNTNDGELRARFAVAAAAERRTWRASSRGRASPTSRSRPTATGCATSPSSSGGGAR